MDKTYEELREHASNELIKVLEHKNANKPIAPSTQQILDQSISFADNPLKRLVSHTLGCDVDELFDEYSDTIGEILISNDNKKYTLKLDIVPKEYMLDLGEFKGNKQVIEKIVFLLNTVKVLFCPIKDHMRTLRSFNYVLQISHNTTLFLDELSEKRIGIILTRV